MRAAQTERSVSCSFGGITVRTQHCAFPARESKLWEIKMWQGEKPSTAVVFPKQFFWFIYLNILISMIDRGFVIIFYIIRGLYTALRCFNCSPGFSLVSFRISTTSPAGLPQALRTWTCFLTAWRTRAKQRRPWKGLWPRANGCRASNWV